MDPKRIVALVVGASVMVLIFSALLVPIINDATTTEKTFDNTSYGYYQMKALEVGDIWERNESTWTHNDETLVTQSLGTVSILALDNTAVRQNGQLRGTTQSSNNFVNGEVTEEGILLFNEDKPIPFDSGYGATLDGDYILKTYSDKAYVNGDTALWVTGVSGFNDLSSNANFIVHIEGTIDDGVTITVTAVKNGTSSNFVVGDYTINYAPVAGYNDLYLIDNITFNVTAYNSEAEDNVTTAVSYSTFVLPKEVTAELTIHPDSATNALLSAIPIIVMIGIVLAVVGVAIVGRNDY